jgi:SAM-dependent methyltransferase
MSKPRYSLYSNWSRYDSLFPVEEEDVAFFDRLMPRSGLVLDYGAGSGSLAARLKDPARDVIALDPYPVESTTWPLALRGTGLALPLRTGSLEGLYSRLFGFAYASAADESAPYKAIDEVSRVLRPNAAMALELPMAWAHHRLTGVEERARLSDGSLYRNQYQERLNRSELGSLYHFLIELEDADSIGEISGRVFVFEPSALANAFARYGFSNFRFYAAYDLTQSRESPPSDVLRGVLYAEKRAG